MGTALFVAVAIVVGFIFFSQPTKITLGRATQITNDGRSKNTQGAPLLTDGTRLYFDETISGHEVIAEVSTSGGDTNVIPTTLPLVGLEDISPRGSELLINSGDADPDNPLWLLPLPAGSPHRLGDVSAAEASWSPDGRQIAYIKGMSELYVVNSDGTGMHKLLSRSEFFPKADFYNVVFFPDGRRLRLGISNRQNDRSAFWDVNVDGSGLHLILPEDWNNTAPKDFGRWTADGKYFVFNASDDGRDSDLWALRDCWHAWFGCRAQTFRLTNGPLLYAYPLPSKDAERIFAIGIQKHAELVRHDPRSGQFNSFLSGISAAHVSFSQDGQWVTWVSYPENTLWCGRADGSDRRQLTYPPLLVVQVSLSRDATRIAFTAQEPGQPWRIYTIPRDGGAATPVLMEQRSQLGATWSPDDRSIAFGRVQSRESDTAVQLLDLKSGKVSELPGSQGLWFPTWSPDGRYLTAATRDVHHLMILDFQTGKWNKTAQVYLNIEESYFSRDSKHVYFEDIDDATIYRASVPDLKAQRVVSLKDLRRPALPYWPPWFGLAPDESILAMRDLGTSEVYAFDLQK